VPARPAGYQEKIDLPEGWWNVLADSELAMDINAKAVNGKIILKPSTGIILKKK